MTVDQILPWLTVILVFGGMTLINLRFISAFITLSVGNKPQPPVPPPVPPPPRPPVPPATPATDPALLDLLKRLLPPTAPVKPPAPPQVPVATPAAAATGPFANAPLWFLLGLKDIGFHETGDNRGIETFIAQAHVGALGDPWCSIWACAKLEQSGAPGTRSASSQSFVGHPDFVRLSGPALGAIVVFWRGTPPDASGRAAQGHVGFYVDETATAIRVLGGNEGDMVQIEALPKSAASWGLVGYFWPKSAPLPRIGAIPTPAGSLAHVVSPPTVGSPAPGTTLTGRMSVFGGPSDTGVQPSEGLALVEPSELDKFPGVFLPEQPTGTTGLARRLDPKALYLACRWDYKATPRAFLQGITVAVSAHGKTLQARPIDWGPNEKTGRIADLSPGLAAALGLQTDDTCEVVIPPTATPHVT